jgi:hypothetical protein
MVALVCCRRDRTLFGSRMRFEKRLEEVEGVGEEGWGGGGNDGRTWTDVVGLTRVDGVGLRM